MGLAVFDVAWPIAVIGILRTGLLLTDSYWVGQLGDDALAGLGAAAFGWWIINTIAELPATGVHALVAQRLGAQDPTGLRAVADQGLWGAALTSVTLLAGAVAIGPYLDLLGIDNGSGVRAPAASFLAASLGGASTLCLHTVVGGVFRGLGDTRVALGITVVAFAVNAVLDPLLISRLGIAGAAWATAAANAVGALIGMVVLARRRLGLRMVAPDSRRGRQIFAIGLPIAARGVAFSLVYVVLGRLIVPLGEHHLAALGVGHRLESMAYMVCVAFEVAAATMVGQRFGALDAAGVRQAARAAAWWCGLAMLPIGAALALGAEPLFRWFTDDPATIASGMLYIRIQVAVAVFMALESTYSGAFAGIGNTVPPFWIVTLATFARVPLAWFLAWPLGWGIAGIYAAIGLTTFIRGVITWQWFRAATQTLTLSADSA